MTNVLREICDRKRIHIAAKKQHISEASLHEVAEAAAPPRGFFPQLKQVVDAGDNALIAEVKKASPSKGLIRADFDAVSIALAYERAGATCISVLTDEPYFQGHDDYLVQVKQATHLPILRKDFMLDTYQITESRALGADAILLIMAALSNNQARELEEAAFALGMDVLVEVHDEEEKERALEHLASPLLGVNNRNLKTLAVNLSTAEQLSRDIGPYKLLVCESGIATNADIIRMNRSGYHCFLVGESLMRQDNIEQATRTLLGL